MRLPDGTILMHNDLEHYDPVKAHQYYLRTRQLHPRAKSTEYTVTKGNGKVVKVSPKELAAQKAYVAERITNLKAKLSKLTTELHKKLADAAAADRKAKQAPTAADKTAAKQSSKKYRDKNKTKLAAQAKANSGSSSSSSPGSKTSNVDSLKREISTARDSLKTAVARQRSLAAAKQNG